MRILSVIPDEFGGATINTVKDGHYIEYHYSGIYELIRDPNNPHQWCQWNGGTLTEAIQWVISLPGSEKDNFSIEIIRTSDY